MADQEGYKVNIPIVRGTIPPPLPITVPVRLRIGTIGGDFIECIVSANSEIHTAYGNHSVLTGIEIALLPELLPCGPRAVPQEGSTDETSPDNPAA